VQAALDSFPAPALTFGPEGDLKRTTWVFRGLKSTEYGLEPRIERDSKGKSCSWPALESMQLLEFQSKAPMYMNAYELPHPEDKPSWLALMQHQGIPTRLLDFSYSPYVALYFVLRERTEKEQSRDGALWAIDTAAVAHVAEQTFIDAEREEAERRLFQMNIHDLALFPDMEGLATFVRQKARLHFAS
jgi:hypothetical protein